MAIRTNANAVKGILGDDYDSETNRPLQPFLESATVIVNRVATCATAKGKALTTGELELIERWLTAHLYTKSDPTYSSRSTSGASGSFIRSPEVPEPYKDGALSVDYSGCLSAILGRKTASAVWLGRPPSEQTAYEDRR